MVLCILFYDLLFFFPEHFSNICYRVLNKLESGGEEAEKCKCLRQLVNIALGNNFEVEENETCTNEENRPVRTVEDLQKLLSDDPSEIFFKRIKFIKNENN